MDMELPSSPIILSNRKKLKVKEAQRESRHIKMFQRPQSTDFKEKSFSFEDKFTIGRCSKEEESPDNGLFSADIVSRQHAEVFFKGSNFFIQDNNSMNGTYKNDDKLKPGIPASLKCNDIVRLGNTKSHQYRPIIAMVELNPCSCLNHDTFVQSSLLVVDKEEEEVQDESQLLVSNVELIWHLKEIEKMKKEDDKDSEQKKVMIHDIPDAEKSKDYRNVETQEFSGSQHRNEAPSHHDDDHDEDQYTNDTIPDSLKYDPDKFDIEFVIPKRRSRK